MKKTIIGLLSLLLFASNLSANKPGALPLVKNPVKLNIGLIGLYNYSYLYNRNIALDRNQTFNYTPEITYGLSASLYFTKRTGIETNLIFGNLIQEYSTNFDDDITLNGTITVEKIDIPVLFHLGKIFYMEVGPQFSFVGNGSHSLADSISKSTFAPSYISAVWGNGFNINFKSVNVHLGYRLNIGLTDLKGSDGFGNDLNNDEIYDSPTISIPGVPNFSSYDQYRSTFPLSASLKFGIGYTF